MKNIKWVILLLIIAVIIVWGKRMFSVSRDDTIPSRNAMTQIEVDTTLVNVLKIPLKKKVTGVFKIANKGSNELIIENVEADCHCTTPDWTKSPISPDSFTLIRLVYDAHTPGFFQKNAIVTGNFDGSPLLLTIRGEVIDNK